MKRFDRRYVWALGALALVLLALAAATVYLATREAKPIQVAVLAPLSGDYASSGKAMLAGAKLRAERVSEHDGVHGRPLEIVAYDTQAKPNVARQQARKIVDTDAVAVVGPYFSSTAVAIAPIINKAHLPAVTGSATAPRLVRDNPWYFRVVPDNDIKGRFSALYTDGVLDIHNVNVVFEDDAYGRTLGRAYRNKARQLGLTVDHAWAVDSSASDTGARLDRIVRQLHDAGPDSALFVALLGRDSARLVAKLHAANAKVTVIGGDSIGLDSFREAFDALGDAAPPMAEATRGVYATTYFLADVANQRAQRFIGAFKKRYQRAAHPVAATHYDAVGMIAAALQHSGRAGLPPQQRQDLRQNLTSFDSLKTAYRGVTGRLFFDKQGSVVKPSTFGVYQQGTLISAPVQLTPVLNPQAQTDLNTSKTASETITLGGHNYYKTDVIYTGVDVNRIDKIDPKDKQFDADFYLWFRYRDSADFSPEDVMFTNAVSSITLGQPLAQRDDDHQHYVAYRVNASFNTGFDFHNFPFDKQTLTLQLRPKHLQSNRVRLVPDDIGMHDSRTDPSRAVLGNSNAWRLQNLRVFDDIDATLSTLGNPRLIATNSHTQISYSRLNVFAHIKRLGSSYVLSNLAPLFFVLILGYAMLYVPVEGPPFTARLNLGVLALLTTVSFSLKTSRQLPDVGYLVLIDYLYFAIYFMLLYGIGSSILKLIWFKQGYEVRVTRLEFISRALMPALLIAAVLIVIGVFGIRN